VRKIVKLLCAQLIVTCFKTVAIFQVVSHEISRRCVKIDMVLEAGEPIGKPGSVIRATSAIEGQAPSRPEPELLGSWGTDELS
jgi:hypothetical protein